MSHQHGHGLAHPALPVHAPTHQIHSIPHSLIHDHHHKYVGSRSIVHTLMCCLRRTSRGKTCARAHTCARECVHVSWTACVCGCVSVSECECECECVCVCVAVWGQVAPLQGLANRNLQRACATSQGNGNSFQPAIAATRSDLIVNGIAPCAKHDTELCAVHHAQT